jgi:A/G-specific adenine glycosylase
MICYIGMGWGIIFFLPQTLQVIGKAGFVWLLSGGIAYTVGAVLSFAFNQPAPLVDANVSRVFARLFNDPTPVDSPAGRKQHWKLAAEMVHPTNPRAYNSAIMELGQTICTSSRPDCLLCPLRQWCRAEQPENLPVKLPKKEITTMEHHDIFLLTEAGLLLEKQAGNKRHAGMYRLPRRSTEHCAALPHLADQKYSITRYKVTRHLYQAAAEESPQPGEEFIPLSRLDDTPMASPDRKIIRQFLP